MSSGFPAGPTSRSVVAESARLRAVELARSEGAILADSLALASTALAAIRFRSRHPAMECAEVRALGLERLPNSDYLGLVVQRLCTELGRSHSRQTWLAAVEEQAGEIEAMLQLAVTMTSVIDVAGELDLPLSQVTAVQTGARSVVLTHGDPPARAWFAHRLGELMPNTRVLDPVPLQTYQV